MRDAAGAVGHHDMPGFDAARGMPGLSEFYVPERALCVVISLDQFRL